MYVSVQIASIHPIIDVYCQFQFISIPNRNAQKQNVNELSVFVRTFVKLFEHQKHIHTPQAIRWQNIYLCNKFVLVFEIIQEHQ